MNAIEYLQREWPDDEFEPIHEATLQAFMDKYLGPDPESPAIDALILNSPMCRRALENAPRREEN